MVWLAIDLGIVLGGFALLALGRWAIDFAEARFSTSSRVRTVQPGPEVLQNAQNQLGP